MISNHNLQTSNILINDTVVNDNNTNIKYDNNKHSIIDAEYNDISIDDDTQHYSILQQQQQIDYEIHSTIQSNNIDNNDIDSNDISTTTTTTQLSIEVESLNTWFTQQTNNISYSTTIYPYYYQRLYDNSTIIISIFLLCCVLLTTGIIGFVNWSTLNIYSQYTTLDTCDSNSNMTLRISILEVLCTCGALLLLCSIDLLLRLQTCCTELSYHNTTIYTFNILYTLFTISVSICNITVMIYTILNVTSECRSIQPIVFNYIFLVTLFISCINFASSIYNILCLVQQYKDKNIHDNSELERTAVARYIDNIPVQYYNHNVLNNNIDNNTQECCICMNEYIINDEIIVLDCKHNFHATCIKTWLRKKNSCAICRSKLTIPYQFNNNNNNNVHRTPYVSSPTSVNNADNAHVFI